MRFPGFQDEWALTKLGEVTKLITKGTTPARFADQGVKFIKIECFEGDQINAQKCLYVDAETHGKELKRSMLEEGDLLFAIAGATIGKINKVNRELLPANTNQALAIIRLNDHENADFIYQILRSEIMRKYIKDSIAVGAQPNLNLEQMGNFKFFRPDITEQNKIARFLSLIDERIRTQNKIIDELESSIKKMIDDMFSQRIRFPGFQDSWVRTTVEKQCLINPRTEKVASEFVYVDLELVEKGELMRTVIFQRSEAPSRASRVLEDGDILFQCVRPYQLNNYLYWKRDDKQWVASTGYAQIRTNNNPVFIYYLLHQTEFNNEVMMRCSGTSYPAISGNELGKIPISICSQDEQNKIANLLSALDEKIRTEKSMLQQLKIQKKYLLHSLFDIVA